MRRATTIPVVVALLVIPAAAAAATEAVNETRPSMLLVTIDTLRADRVGCYGATHARTPVLDGLAARGLRFDEARAHTPLTLPSHGTLLTGLLPPHHGLRGNGLFVLDPQSRTLAEELRLAGWSTGAVVASVVLDRAHGLDRGFEQYDDNQHVGDRKAFDYLERGASQIADRSLAMLDELEPPFLLWAHLYDPHVPWVAPPEFSVDGGDGYDAEIAFADAAVGRIVEHAQRRAGGRLIVVVTSDHGESLGGHGEQQHGYTLHRGVMRVPLIIAGPGLPSNRVPRGDVGLVDVAPTILDLAGLPALEADGRSLRASWSTPAPIRAEPIWEESLHPLYDSGWAPLRGLLTPGWHVVDAPRPELYDRRRDPRDLVDLASSRPRILERMLGRLRQRAAALGDDEAEPQPTLDDDAQRHERLARLAALGYVSGKLEASAGNSTPRLDPKDGLPGFRALESADILLDAGRPLEAAAVVEPWARRDVRNPRLWHQLGRSLLAAGELERARVALEQALALAPEQQFVRLTHAALLRASGEIDAERAALELLVDDTPRAVDAVLRLAEIAVERDDHAGSERILDRSYRAGARDPDLLARLGHHALARDDRSLAATRFREALELRPNDDGARLGSGRLALREGKAVEAIEQLERCSNGPLAFECRVELARAWVVGPGDLARAEGALRAALELAAGDPRRLEQVQRRLQVLAELRAQRPVQE